MNQARTQNKRRHADSHGSGTRLSVVRLGGGRYVAREAR
jgi:hypothetical protein